MNCSRAIPFRRNAPSMGVSAPFSAKSGTLNDQSPARSGGFPPAVASISFTSIWLTGRMRTSMRFCERLKSSTTACMASSSKPLHFSQYETITRPSGVRSLTRCPQPAAQRRQAVASSTRINVFMWVKCAMFVKMRQSSESHEHRINHIALRGSAPTIYEASEAVGALPRSAIFYGPSSVTVPSWKSSPPSFFQRQLKSMAGSSACETLLSTGETPRRRRSHTLANAAPRCSSPFAQR